MRLPAASYRLMPWKNGQGMTREIAREPCPDGEAGGDFLWRLSIAEVAASGDFSLFAGCERWIALIEGAGMRLDFAEAPSRRIDRRFEPFAFSGDWHCRCSLLAGPVRDFNLIADRARVQAGCETLGLGGSPVERRVESGWLLVYCAQGRLRAGGFEAEAGDTVRLGAGRHGIEGRGAVALAVSLHMRRGR